jgi:ribosomal protein S12 methylthiotransferase accessory factor YcaO
MKLNLILASLFVLGLSISMTGCEGGAKLEEELAATKATLELTQQKLDTVSQARDALQKQVTELIRLRDEAVSAAKNAQTRIDGLTKQFEEQAKVIRELQEHMKQMQSAIEKL